MHDPILRISIAYCERTIAVTQAMRLREIHVAQLRSMVSRKTGLPVSMFRMLSARGLELFDGHSLDDYEVQVGDTIRVESWDGANDFLALCQRGFAKHALAELEREKEASVVRYLLRVALYMAAHFGHLELASATVKLGVSPSEGVGEHPFRDWHRGGPQHPDVARTPIHEASEFGTIAILRLFIHQDITHVLANDGNGLKPLNLALRNHQREAASLLIAKQWMRQEYETITISIQFINRLRKWANRSRERAFLKYGEQRSTFRPKRGAVVHIGARVGEQSFFVTGFTRDGLSSKPRALLKKPPLHNVHTEAAADAIPRRVAKTRLQRATGDEPSAAAESLTPAEIDAHSLRLLENYFKSLGSAYESNRPNAQLALPQPPLVRRHPNGRVELLAQCAQQPQEADTGRHVTLVAASGTRGEPIQSQSTGTSIRDAVNASRSSASVKQRSDANSRSLLATPSSETAGGRPSLPEEQRSFGSLDEPNTRLSFYNGSTARTGVRAASTSSAGHSVYKSRSLSESTCRSRDIRSSSKASAESNQREEAEELSLEVNAGPPQMIDRDTSAQVSTLNTTDTPKSTKVNSQLLHIRNTESCRLAKSSTPNSSSRILVLINNHSFHVVVHLFI